MIRVFKPLTDAKDIIFQQFDGNKVLEINDGGFVGIGGNSNVGEIRIFEDTDDGNNYVGLKVGNVSTAYTLVLPNVLTDQMVRQWSQMVLVFYLLQM